MGRVKVVPQITPGRFACTSKCKCISADGYAVVARAVPDRDPFTCQQLAVRDVRPHRGTPFAPLAPGSLVARAVSDRDPLPVISADDTGNDYDGRGVALHS